jgi:hypothetical protein
MQAIVQPDAIFSKEKIMLWRDCCSTRIARAATAA